MNVLTITNPAVLSPYNTRDRFTLRIFHDGLRVDLVFDSVKNQLDFIDTLNKSAEITVKDTGYKPETVTAAAVGRLTSKEPNI